jgi:hypothetical protein
MMDIFEEWYLRGQDIRDEDVLELDPLGLKEEVVRNDSFKLYRYMPATYFNIRNIETETIHLSSNGVLNDIYEGLPQLNKEADYYELQKLDDLVSMTCMTETKDNNLMWSHYADSHQGLCVEYDFRLLEDDPFNICYHLFPVLYRKERFIISLDVKTLISSYAILKKAIDESWKYDGDAELDNILPMFLVKSTDWKYENEWRIIYSKKEMYDINDPKLYFGNIGLRCITGVYLGCRIHPEIRKNIVEICERISTSRKPVAVYQCKVDREGYDIISYKIL